MTEAVDPDPGDDVPDDRVVPSTVPSPVPALPRPGEVVSALPGLTRIAAATGLNATRWGLFTTLRLSRRLLQALRDPAAAAALAQELGVTVATVLDLARAVAGGTPVPQALARAVEVEEAQVVAGEVAERRDGSLRERGAELLARSRDVWDDQEEHPAYARILEELAPDEARVLVLLARSGPQPSVDVRSGGPVGRVHSQLIAPGLTMVGARAGLRHVDRVPAYLDNLHRLGLVWFAREQLDDPMEYQVLEAQPDVLEAMHAQRFTKVLRRSIHLTPFGEDFCEAVLLADDGPTGGPGSVE